MIKVVNLTKKTKDKTIIDNLNYDFLPSNLYQIRGLNGTGKSTLLKLLGGIVEPTDGLIFYGNKKLDENTLVDLKQHSICYIDQVHDLIYHKTVLFNLQLESYILNKDVEMETIKTALEKFGLGDKLQTKIRNLSGGERRIISFLKGYLSHKDIILYDEITSNVDRHNKNIMLQMIQEQVKSKTIILATNEKIDHGIIIDINQPTTYQESIIYEENNTKNVANESMLKRKYHTFLSFGLEYVLILMLIIFFVLVFAIKATMLFTSYGQIYYDNYINNENEYIVLNDNYNKISEDHVFKEDIHRIIKTSLNFGNQAKQMNISITNQIEIDEVIISRHLVTNLGLNIGDEIIIEGFTYRIKNVIEPLNILNELDVIFNSYPHTLENYELSRAYFAYAPSKDVFNTLISMGIFSGYQFNFNENITLSINQALFYELIVNVILIFLTVSIIIILVFYNRQIGMALWTTLYILFNIGVTRQDIQGVKNQQISILLIATLLLAIPLYNLSIIGLNQLISNVSDVQIIIFNKPLLGITAILLVLSILYILLSFKKTKVHNLY